MVLKKTVSNETNCHGLYVHLPWKTPLYDEALLKFAEQYLYKLVKYWGNIVWSDETKIELFGCHNTRHVWRSKGTFY